MREATEARDSATRILNFQEIPRCELRIKAAENSI